MQKLNSKVTDSVDFFQGNNPFQLIKNYGSPLYIYNEKILRKNCREIKQLVKYKNFQANYSAKANSNLALLQIVKQEGLSIDAMSSGEIYVQLEAGFKPEDIFYICNNVSEEEMLFAIERGITTSVDSLSQLEQYGRLNPGGKVAVRFNAGVGDGHHQKVITSGKDTKFGVNVEYLDEVKEILKKHNLRLCGINHHVGSLFMDADKYLQAAGILIEFAKKFDDLDFIDIGGGFGIPYHKQEDEKRLDLKVLGQRLDEMINDFVKSYGKEIIFKVEPGRYIMAETSVLLGEVHAIKYNADIKYIGTDLGFNVLQRPMIYDAHHDIEIYRLSNENDNTDEMVTIVGNLCESGDIIAKNRVLPKIMEKDILGILDAGAYGHVMSSNYNNRLRTAEVLIRENNEPVLIRKRDSFEDLIRNYISLE